MHGVAAFLGQVRHRRLSGADAGPGLGRRSGAGDGGAGPGVVAVDPARALVARGAVGDQAAAAVGIGGRQQRVGGQVGVGGVAVIGLAVGEGELHRLGDAVDEVGAREVHVGDARAVEQAQRLQEGGALAPHAGLPDGPAVVVDRKRVLVAGLPAGHVGAGQHALPALAGGVHDAGGGASSRRSPRRRSPRRRRAARPRSGPRGPRRPRPRSGGGPRCRRGRDWRTGCRARGRGRRGAR